MAWKKRGASVRLSSLAPQLFDLASDGRCQSIVCPRCDRWRLVKRNLISPHRRGTQESPWCSGSGQHLICDVTVQQWRTDLEAAARLASLRACQARLPHARRRGTPPPLVRA